MFFDKVGRPKKEKGEGEKKKPYNPFKPIIYQTPLWTYSIIFVIYENLSENLSH
jgi:hypothetical protein